MDIYQLKTFITIAREGSITRASDSLHLSQPAVSSHIKALEDEVEFALFERNARGMTLTEKGARLLVKARLVMAAQHELLMEAKLLQQQAGGKLRLGSNRAPSALILGKLLTQLAESFPDIDVKLQYGGSAEIETAIAAGELDAGFFSDSGMHSVQLKKWEVDKFGVYLAAPNGWFDSANAPDWPTLATMPWICPATNSCCGNVAEHLFNERGFRPQKQVSVDHEKVTRTLIAGGVGIGFLHADTAQEAQAKGEVVLLGDVQRYVSVYFGVLKAREQEPVLASALSIINSVVLNT